MSKKEDNVCNAKRGFSLTIWITLVRREVQMTVQHAVSSEFPISDPIPVRAAGGKMPAKIVSIDMTDVRYVSVTSNLGKHRVDSKTLVLDSLAKTRLELEQELALMSPVEREAKLSQNSAATTPARRKKDQQGTKMSASPSS
jgi:hypothetical protein